ncbi:MAG: phosphorylase [Sphingobacteriaceae bacterium]|nr:phosphorylase [Sphingobacteriaceae bacterium]
MPFAASELILTPAGAVYHLNLLPEQLAPTVLLVGDPDRVKEVSKHFDQVWYKVQHREFITHTGLLNGKSVSVVSTGIGTDNIDIVLNELDALVNIDLISREPKALLTSLNLVRLGTSGALQADIQVDSLVCSSHGLGLDGLMPYYQASQTAEEKAMTAAFKAALPDIARVAHPYVFEGSKVLLDQIAKDDFFKGITLTCPGFYAPQGRSLRYQPVIEQLPLRVGAFQFAPHRVTNFEMETAGIYGLARVLGHQALSANAIIANRVKGSFSLTPQKTIEKLITTVLERLLG